MVCNTALTSVTYFSAFFNNVLSVFLVTTIYVRKTGRKSYGNKVVSFSLCTQARRQAEAALEEEWKEMINGIDQQALLKEREFVRKQR
jgi:hypothetical protein